jgi:hypothetical protein
MPSTTTQNATFEELASPTTGWLTNPNSKCIAEKQGLKFFSLYKD